MKLKIMLVVMLVLVFSLVGCKTIPENEQSSASGSVTNSMQNSNSTSTPQSTVNSTGNNFSGNAGGSSNVKPSNSSQPPVSTKPSSNPSNPSHSVTPSSSQGGGTSVPDIVPSGEYTLKNAELSGSAQGGSVALYNAEGYGAGVTGGGNLKRGDADYYQVSTAEEFIKAIGRKNYDNKSDKGFVTRPAVVEVMNDIDLGWNKIGSTAQNFSDVIEANKASVHPTLKNTGVSTVYINGRENLTIFSRNGASISHACFQIRGTDGSNGQNKNCKNIIIRNIKFIGPWEWDDSGKYDANDWDIFTIRADKGPVSKIWIDHCTFTKPYDGTIDVKYGATDITISYCSFIPYNHSDGDFMDMMNYLESNRASFPNYNSARNAGASFEDMVSYASINKKVHLIGHTDNNPGDENIRVTYCNNYYENCTERLPRLRLGKAHVYNCIFNATASNELKVSIKKRGIAWPSALTFASNGSLGTNYGKLLLENCNISGINTPLRNNNKKDGEMYVGACDALYTYYSVQDIDRKCDYGIETVRRDGKYVFLGHSTKADGNLMTPFPSTPLAFDTDAFKSQLGYDYTLYDPEKLYQVLGDKVGAGTLNFSDEQWKKSSYSANETQAVKDLGGLKGSTANLGASRK